MSEKRYLGVDLHRRVFTCCVRLESGRPPRNRSCHHRPGPQASRNYLSHAEEQLGVRGLPQFRFAGSDSVKRTSVTTE